jgi:hypothetical protein
MDAINLFSMILSDSIDQEVIKELCIEAGVDQGVINEVLVSMSEKMETRIHREVTKMTNESIHKINDTEVNS